MSDIYVSIVVASHSRTIDNTMLRYEVPLDLEQAALYRASIEKWLQTMPTPDNPHFETLPAVIEQPIDEVAVGVIVVDEATHLAARLSEILPGRDPELFGPYYRDAEAEAAFMDHRPYDWTQLEDVDGGTQD